MTMTSSQKIVIFLIYGQFAADRKPDSGRIVCKTYIFINSNVLPYKNWKQNSKIFIIALTLLLWLRYYICQKNWFFAKKCRILQNYGGLGTKT